MSVYKYPLSAVCGGIDASPWEQAVPQYDDRSELVRKIERLRAIVAFQDAQIGWLLESKIGAMGEFGDKLAVIDAALDRIFGVDAPPRPTLELVV